MGVEQVEQGNYVSGNTETIQITRSCLCLRDEYNGNTLFHLFHRGRESTRQPVFWNRMIFSTLFHPHQFEVMT